MLLDRLRYELKVTWKAMILFPVTAMSIMLLFILLQYSLHQSPAHTLVAVLEMFVPLSAGLVAASLTAQDAALELHLTTPRAYHNTAFLRLLMLSGWTALLSLLNLGCMAALRMLYLPDFALSWSPLVQILCIQLVWLIPLLWFMAVGMCIALLTQSRAASGALLGGIWLISILFAGIIAAVEWLRPVLLFPVTLLLFPTTHIPQADFTKYWFTTRWEMLLTAAILFPACWFLLHNTDRLLKGASEE